MFALGLGWGAGHKQRLAVVAGTGSFRGGVCRSVEFLLVGMITTAAPLSAIALTTLLVNARHIFYGLLISTATGAQRVAEAVQHVRTDG